MPSAQINTDLVNQHFAANSEHVYAASDLGALLIQKQSEWNLPPSMTSYTFLGCCLKKPTLPNCVSDPATTLLSFSTGATKPQNLFVPRRKDW